MRKSTHKKFVQDHLKLMFNTVRHGSQIEREVCEYVNMLNHYTCVEINGVGFATLCYRGVP